MKARIKGTNIELDVQPFYDETGYFAGFKNDYEYYRAADLVFPDTPDWDTTDWSAFRREAAKDIFARSYNPIFLVGPQVKNAINATDELIKLLKEEQK